MARNIFLLLAASAGLASAFVPRGSFMGAKTAAARSRSLQMSVNDLIGADVETGGIWDPLGLSQDAEALTKYRAVELKHGRVAMLAALGVAVQSYVQLPDAVFNNPRPLGALQQIYEQRPEALWQIFFALGFLEFTAFRQYEDKAPGDFNFGKEFKPKTEKEYAALQLKELKNGRLAMVAILGALYQETLTGQGPIEQLVSGHFSPFGDGQGFF